MLGECSSSWPDTEVRSSSRAMALATGTQTGGDASVWRRANSAAAADVNRAASTPSLLPFRVRLPRLSGKPFGGSWSLAYSSKGYGVLLLSELK